MSVKLIDHVGSDLSIVNAARVSYGGESKGADKDRGLLRYMLKNGHTSPFEHVVFTFRVECPIFVARQWLRHRTWSFNEVSYRYTEASTEMWKPDVWRAQSDGNKQMSDGVVPYQGVCHEIYRQAWEQAYEAYEELLGMGVAREQARAILPLSTMTSFYGTVDLHNLLGFLQLRLHPHAQPEITEYAKQILDLITPLVPTTIELWKELQA